MASLMTNSFNVTTEVVSVNDTSENTYFYLRGELYDQYVKRRIGTIVFLSVLMVIGVIGNVHVLYIYAFKFPKTTFRIYILFLAVLDVVACSVCIPFTIATRFIRFESIVCALMNLLLYFNSAAPASILLVITIDRYRKICRPLRKQMNKRAAKIACSTALLLSLLITLPAPVVYMMRMYRYQIYYNVLIFYGSVGLVSLIVLYCLIGIRLWKHGKARSKPLHPKIASPVPVSEPAARTNSVSSTADVPDSGFSSNVGMIKTTPGTVDLTTQMKDKSSNNQKNQRLNDGKTTENNNKTRNNLHMNKVRKTTLIFFIITVVLIVSFVPHLVIVKTNYAMLTSSVTFAEMLLGELMYCSFFINNVANPIIYGFCDPRFRRDVRSMYIKLFCKR